ncbi:primosomal protein DnaI [Limosilactobacillus mucosae]|uniref:primosomal protein DnaI n=1 Tax=Limosilactobacillus mucosae TaxID=97478 RepID=UPI0039924E72
MRPIIETINSIIGGQSGSPQYQELIKKAYQDPEVQNFLREHRAELTDEQIKRGGSKLYEFYHEKMLLQNHQTSIAPGYTPQLVVSAGRIDVVYVPTAQLKAQQQAAELRQRVTTVRMPKFIRQANFSDIYDGNVDRMKATQAAMNFVDSYQPGQFQPGMYLSGSFGVGKTYLLGATANALAKKGFISTMVHFPSFAVEMKGAIKDGTINERRDAIKKAPILMLDDIGADSMSAWVRDDVLGVILEYRMQEELPTFFSSNFTMQQLEDQHLAIDAQGAREPLKAKRIMQRIRFLSQEYHIQGENMRAGN